MYQRGVELGAGAVVDAGSGNIFDKNRMPPICMNEFKISKRIC